jgi:hypothetical protein
MSILTQWPKCSCDVNTSYVLRMEWNDTNDTSDSDTEDFSFIPSQSTTF